MSMLRTLTACGLGLGAPGRVRLGRPLVAPLDRVGRLGRHVAAEHRRACCIPPFRVWEGDGASRDPALSAPSCAPAMTGAPPGPLALYPPAGDASAAASLTWTACSLADAAVGDRLRPPRKVGYETPEHRGCVKLVQRDETHGGQERLNEGIESASPSGQTGTAARRGSSMESSV